MNTIQKVIMEAIETDDSFTNKNYLRMLDLYNNALPESKILIDDIFINLCGYSFSTLAVKSIQQRWEEKEGIK